MLVTNNSYIFYYKFLFLKFSFLFNLNNIFLSYNFNFQKNILTYYKANVWIFHFVDEMEDFIIVYYFEYLYQNNIPFLGYKNNFNSFFVKRDFKFYIYNQYNIIKNYVITLLSIIFFNVKWILISFIIAFLYFFFSLFYLQLEFTKQIAIWFILLIAFYLLMSTFNNFLNKYKYGKFTSAIQRFWKRTGMTFWLIEGFLFLIFFYYFLNSSQEPLYMHDYANLNQEFLIQLKVSYKNMILLSFAIYFSFILILNNNFLNYFQNVVLLTIISLIVFYMLYIETYQFVYIITLFAEKNWLFEEITQTWVLEFEQSNLRVKQQYFILCLIAKYWHFIFIFISWFFFVIKCFEINKINYNMLGYNVQNLLILYILNLFCLIQWGKWVFKKFLEVTYYWFHIQYDEKIFIVIINEIKNILFSFINFNLNLNIINNFKIISIILLQSNEAMLWKYIIWLKKILKISFKICSTQI